MPFYEFEGKKPSVSESAYVHPLAVVVGDVTIGESCYIGPTACLRADFGRILVEDGSNVQEGCVVHCDPDKVAIIGPESTMGHRAILHGARTGRRVLIGMGAIVLDGAELGDNCVIASGAVVTGNTKIPKGKLVMGIPAKIVGDLSPQRDANQTSGTELYKKLPQRYHSALRQLSETEVRQGK